MINIEKNTLNKITITIKNANFIDLFNNDIPFTGYYLVKIFNDAGFEVYLPYNIDDISTADINRYISLYLTEGTNDTLNKSVILPGTNNHYTFEIYWIDETFPVIEVIELPNNNHYIKSEYASVIGENNITNNVYL